MACYLEKVEGYNAEAGLKLNITKCAIMTVDKTKTILVNFELIPDIMQR